jgi:glycerol uptake facilitator-like aquaporin
MISTITGGCLNPTLGLAAMTFRELVRKSSDPSYIVYLPAYFFGPLISGLISALFVRYVALVVTPEPYFDDKTTTYSKSQSIH